MGIIKNMQEYLTEEDTIDPPVEDIINHIAKVRPENWNPNWTES